MRGAEYQQNAVVEQFPAVENTPVGGGIAAHFGDLLPRNGLENAFRDRERAFPEILTTEIPPTAAGVAIAQTVGEL